MCLAEPGGMSDRCSTAGTPLRLINAIRIHAPHICRRHQLFVDFRCVRRSPECTARFGTCASHVDWHSPRLRRTMVSSCCSCREQGKTTLSFRIGTDGIPKNVAVTAGSGYADLDDAATKCVATWRYQPAIADGNPVEVDWKATVEWSMPAGKTVYVTASHGHMAAAAQHQDPVGSQVCHNPTRPAAPLGTTSTVMFWVLADGSITHLKLIRSSGNEKLDNFALECASQWRYTPWPGSARHVSVMFVPIPW